MNIFLQKIKWVMIIFCLFIEYSFANTIKPDLLLAKVYDDRVIVKNYWISEKYDGVRAYWNGKKLLSKAGNTFNAPKWFILAFPKQSLDGELWIGRGKFSQVLSAVRKKVPLDAEWRKVKYMVFELPDKNRSNGTFTQRLRQLKYVLANNKNPYIQLVPQFRLTTKKELIVKLQQITNNGGEGLMLHRAEALYNTGRNSDLLKLKLSQKAKAIVLAHLAGKGKYTGMLGALLVQTINKKGKKIEKSFRIGTGFSDLERKNPPKIGAIITYKYHGKTRKNIPRFASYLGTSIKNKRYKPE